MKPCSGRSGNAGDVPSAGMHLPMLYQEGFPAIYPSGVRISCKGDARVIIHRRHILRRSPQPDGGSADLW